MTPGRNQLIDIMRFGAAFGVLIGHFAPLTSALYRSVHFSRVGVVVSFVISGLLVGRNLLQYRISIDAGQWGIGQALQYFYVRRVLRIFPLYYGVLAVFVAVGYGPIVSQIWWHVTYTSNYGQMLGINMGNAAHFWSLCVEEQFYLLAPLLLLAVPIHRVPRLGLGLLVGCLAVKTGLAFTSRDWEFTTRGLVSNTEGLLIGILMAHKSVTGTTGRQARLWWVGPSGATHRSRHSPLRTMSV